MTPKTVAIIMDGNGRWAKAQGLPRTAGHKQGAQNVKTIALEAQRLGVQKLILYAFSTENWKRPEDEVSYLCKLPSVFFSQYLKDLLKNNIRVSFAGEIDRFPQSTQDVINDAVAKTSQCTGLELCFAINYGSRRELVLGMRQYARDVLDGKVDINIEEDQVSQYLFVPEDIDLMIRTSGELRISNYLLWQIAYAELIFTPLAWPEFDEAALQDCIKEFESRDRRYGGLSE